MATAVFACCLSAEPGLVASLSGANLGPLFAEKLPSILDELGEPQGTEAVPKARLPWVSTPRLPPHVNHQRTGGEEGSFVFVCSRRGRETASAQFVTKINEPARAAYKERWCLIDGPGGACMGWYSGPGPGSNCSWPARSPS
jgi:hypothetical protein